MIDWTKVNPNYLLFVGFGLVLITAGGAVFLWTWGDKSDVGPFLGIMLPLLFGIFGIKTTQGTQMAQKAADKADAGIEQNERIIAKVDAVKQIVNGANKK